MCSAHAHMYVSCIELKGTVCLLGPVCLIRSSWLSLRLTGYGFLTSCSSRSGRRVFAVCGPRTVSSTFLGLDATFCHWRSNHASYRSGAALCVGSEKRTRRIQYKLLQREFQRPPERLHGAYCVGRDLTSEDLIAEVERESRRQLALQHQEELEEQYFIHSR